MTDIPLLELRSISKTYRRRGVGDVVAVNDVSLSINHSEIVALVGESGSGKSSLARIALSLTRPDSGSVLLNGEELANMPKARLRRLRHSVQPVFQDPTAALNPRRSVRQLMSQAMPSAVKGKALDQEVIRGLEAVGLVPGEQYLQRFPHELSGGQRQRLCIARAIAAEPSLIVADEPLSGADVSTRGQILNLLIDLRRRRDLAFLFITHDISVAQAFAHRVAVMFRGAIVEVGEATEIVANPRHEYTQLLIRSATSQG